MPSDIRSLDNLVEECGYFTSRTTVNNGYGCLHPEQEDVEDEYLPSLRHDGVQGPAPFRCGRCFSFSCPLGSELNPSEEPLDAEEFRKQGLDPADFSDGEWMLVTVTDDGRLVGAKEE